LLVIRIRRKEDGALLSFKAKSADPNSDIAWHDYDTPIVEPDTLEDILLHTGYEYVVLIDKVRDSFTWRGFEINIDNIRDLGLFIEVEAQGTEKDIDLKKKQIKDFFSTLGIDDVEIIEKGYVPLMKEKFLEQKLD